MAADLSIGPLRDAERAQAVEVLARAFRDNPLNVAVIGAADPRRRQRANAHAMRSLLPVAQAHGRVLAARLDARLAGALVATRPAAYPLPPAPLLARLRCLAGQGWRVAQRWNAVFETLAALHPLGPHAYLGSLGVDPGLQGRGVGRALLGHWLTDAELEGQAAYLETDVHANIGFYARGGFELEGELQIFGAHIWRMRRPAPRSTA